MRAFRGRTFALVGALLAAVLLATATLAGCADEGGDTGHPGAAGAGPTKALRISATGTDSLPFMAILQVGINKGWF
ncbi:MAG TPA: hypothetical protein VNP03_16060, partial [Pseudonocardia sp.]|nr:hypothetical protein [Pseudonocardia sp.]